MPAILSITGEADPLPNLPSATEDSAAGVSFAGRFGLCTSSGPAKPPAKGALQASR
jgi:hypothetical protein